MSYKVITIPFFDKQLKRLVKKYPSLKTEFSDLLLTLAETPDIGTELGNHCYKIRLGIASKGKGKSGGARVVTYVQVINTSVYLISIYDKGEQGTIPEHDLKAFIKQLFPDQQL